MGLLDFFRKKQPPPPEQVKLGELEPWLKTYVDKKNLDRKLQDYKQTLQEALKQLQESLTALENARLMNKNIPEREFQIMQGNRQNYLQKIRQFIQAIRYPETVSDAGYCSSQLSQDLDQLGRGTEKNHYILQHYYAPHATAITQHLKTLHEQNHAFRQSLENEHLDEVREIQALLQQHQKDLKRLEQLEQQKKDEEQHLPDLKKREEKILQRLEDHQKSPTYQEYQQLNQHRDDLEKQAEQETQALQQAFGTLAYALRKYHYETQDPLIPQYLENPSQALRGDPDLRILTLLKRLQEHLQTLDLKEDKEAKIIELLEHLTPDYLNPKREKLNQFSEQLNEAKAQLANSVIALNIMEQESLLHETRTRIQDTQEKIHGIQDKIDTIPLEATKNKIKEIVEKLGNVILQD